MLSAGLPPGAALRCVGEVLQEAGDPRGHWLLEASRGAEAGTPVRPGAVAGAGHEVDALVQVLRLAEEAGVPPAVLVRRSAAEGRRRGATTRRLALRRVEVLLVLPLGMCLLPAFVLLGVVPMVIALLRGV